MKNQQQIRVLENLVTQEGTLEYAEDLVSSIKENLTPDVLKYALRSEKCYQHLHGLMRRLGNDIKQVANTCD